MTLLTMINLILAIFTGSVGVLAWIELKSFMKSTHRVEYVPLGDSVPVKKEPLRDETLNEYDI